MPDTATSEARLEAAQQQPDSVLSPMEATISAFGGPQLSDLQQKFGGIVALIEPLKMLLDRTTYTDSDGKKVTMGAGALRDPQGFGERWIAQQDAQALSGVLAPLKAEKDALVRKLLTNYYTYRKFSPAAIDQKLSRGSLEKVLVHGMLMLQGHDSALKMLTQAAKQEGIGSADLGTAYGRTQQARLNVLAQLYRTATDMSAQTPLQGASAAKHMQTLLEVYQQGGFKKLLKMPGVFDNRGQFTQYGHALAGAIMKDTGYSIYAAKRLTGQKDPVTAMQGLKSLIGENVAGQLSDPQTKRALASYLHSAQITGLNPTQSMSMLKAIRDLTGKSSLQYITMLGSQKLGFDKMAAIGTTGDLGQWHKLSTMNVVKAATGPQMQTAKIAAAALEKAYGRSAAWNLMDGILLRGSRYRNGFIAEANKLLQGRDRIQAVDAQGLAWSPQAQAYEESGRAIPALTTIGAKQYWNTLTRESPWFRKYAGAVMSEQGDLSTDSIGRYLTAHGATPAQQGRVLQHVSSFGKRFQTDPESLLSFMNAGAKHNERMRMAGEAETRGQESLMTSNLQGAAGIEGMLREGMQEDATPGKFLGGFLGTDRDVKESELPGGMQGLGAVPKFTTPDLTKPPLPVPDIQETVAPVVPVKPAQVK
jgi:hypothetical protein